MLAGNNPISPHSSPDHVLRVSFGWITLAIIIMLLLGVAGGIIANQLWRTPLPPLTNESDRYVPTVQEVTISPSKNLADILSHNNRSVFLLSRSAETTPTATGFVITNDGVLVSITDLTGTTLTAFDYEGRTLPLTRIGRDEIYGLTYYKLPSNNVAVPLDLRPSDPPVGYELLAISRNQNSYQPRTALFLVGEYAIPSDAPQALQRIMRGSSPVADHTPGSPLIDDEGRVAAILQTPTTAYPISHLQASLARTTNNQREQNPFATVGASVAYGFTPPSAQVATTFQAVVTAVAPASPAQAAGLKRGDNITTINGTPVSWEQPVATQLSANLPLTLIVQRNGEATTITISPLTTPPPQS